MPKSSHPSQGFVAAQHGHDLEDPGEAVTVPVSAARRG